MNLFLEYCVQKYIFCGLQYAYLAVFFDFDFYLLNFLLLVSCINLIFKIYKIQFFGGEKAINLTILLSDVFGSLSVLNMLVQLQFIF